MVEGAQGNNESGSEDYASQTSTLSSDEECLSSKESALSYEPELTSDESEVKGHRNGTILNNNTIYNKISREFMPFIPNKNALVNWCIQMGLVPDLRTCQNCHSVREWKRCADGIEYWRCAEEKEYCEKVAVNDKTSFVYEGVSTSDLVALLYVWWINCSIYDRMKHSQLSIENNDHFEATLREISIFGCMKESRKIGGRNLTVNVEIGLRMGVTCQTDVVIGGMEADNYRNMFLTHLNLTNRSLLEIREFIEEWIDPESEVRTNTAVLDPFQEMRWKESKTWTLEFNTGCLAEDLWRQWLLCKVRPFEKLVKTVSEYFDKSVLDVGNQFLFDPNQVNIKEMSKDMDIPELDLMLNPWEFDVHELVFNL